MIAALEIQVEGLRNELTTCKSYFLFARLLVHDSGD
jgi:hypothetical protein